MLAACGLRLAVCVFVSPPVGMWGIFEDNAVMVKNKKKKNVHTAGLSSTRCQERLKLALNPADPYGIRQPNFLAPQYFSKADKK